MSTKSFLVACMTEAVTEAAKRHPGWHALPDGKIMWLGRRAGPRTTMTLLKWFEETYPDECDSIAGRFSKLLEDYDRTTTAG
jgi:hypothetical protein